MRLARTIRRHRDGILAAVTLGLTNARLEGLHSKVRLLSHRSFGFHSAAPLIALIYLCCAGITINPPLAMNPLKREKRPKSAVHTGQDQASVRIFGTSFLWAERPRPRTESSIEISVKRGPAQASRGVLREERSRGVAFRGPLRL